MFCLGVRPDEAHVRLHEPHGAARGARALARRDARENPPAPPRDHLPHQLQLHAGIDLLFAELRAYSS